MGVGPDAHFEHPISFGFFVDFGFFKIFFRGEASESGCHSDSGALRVLEMGVRPDTHFQHPI
jgi:hypothetical protein